MGVCGKAGISKGLLLGSVADLTLVNVCISDLPLNVKLLLIEFVPIRLKQYSKTLEV